MSTKLQEIRCKECGKLLCRAAAPATVEVRCPRCKVTRVYYINKQQ